MKKKLKYILIFVLFNVTVGCVSSVIKNTPIESAAKNNDLKSVKELISKGANPCEKGTYGFTPYYWSLTTIGSVKNVQLCKKSPAFKFLIESAFEVFKKGGDCPGLLYSASVGGCNELVLALLEKDNTIINSEYWSLTPLGAAAIYHQIDTCKILISKGADIESAIAGLQAAADRNVPYLTIPANKESYDSANEGVDFLNSMRAEAKKIEKAVSKAKETSALLETEKESEEQFQSALNGYKKMNINSELPEEARKYKIQAESAVQDKDFTDAAELYRQALKIAPWWAYGHFNRALVLGEAKLFAVAIVEMNRYLALVPKAPNARAAQDKIYYWAREAKKL